ncbi:ribosomal protein S15 [Saguinus oedipus]|uniref:40S ribosomal protein S15 n=1 Tax=Saguinus oedipus TaxID=9490 RepID=A0ABQ9TZE9_SAGOE|nr:ribosomal protein S15 [Saguinus oedipus]
MAEVKQKKRTFYKFTYHGVNVHQLLDMPYEQLMQLRKQHLLLKRLRKATKAAPPTEKPEMAKAEVFPCRPDVIIPSKMVGSMVGVYKGKTFSHVEIKPEMIGHYLGEFSITYKPVKHARPGTGATHSSCFTPK